MIEKSYRARLFLTPEQKRLIDLSIEGNKSSYNYARECMLQDFKVAYEEKMKYAETLKDLSEEEQQKKLDKFKYKRRSVHDISKCFTQHKKTSEYWQGLAQKGANAQACASGISFNFDNAYKNFWRNLNSNFNRIASERRKDPEKKFKFPDDFGFPRKKYDNKCKSYKVQIPISSLDYEKNTFFLSKVGTVRVTKNQPLPMFKKGAANGNFYVMIKTDGFNYYVIFPFDTPIIEFDYKQTDILGIDLGFKEAMILSNGEHIANLSKNEKYKKLCAKIDELNRKKSWLQNHNPKSWNIEDKAAKYKAADSRQFRKICRRIKKLYLKKNNMKLNYMHETAEHIVRLNPKGIVFENLSIKAMQKSKKTAKSAQETSLAAFKNMVIWHAKKHGILVKEADKFFASTQICSECHVKNPKMKGIKNLGKRTFVCPNCGAVIDRDENAARNLKRIWDEIPMEQELTQNQSNLENV